MVDQRGKERNRIIDRVPDACLSVLQGQRETKSISRDPSGPRHRDVNVLCWLSLMKQIQLYGRGVRKARAETHGRYKPWHDPTIKHRGGSLPYRPYPGFPPQIPAIEDETAKATPAVVVIYYRRRQGTRRGGSRTCSASTASRNLVSMEGSSVSPETGAIICTGHSV